MKRNTETLRRLGAPYADCPICKQPFNIERMPKHWVDTIGPMGEDEDDLPVDSMQLCSERCASIYKENEEARLVAEGYQVRCDKLDYNEVAHSWGVVYHPDPP